MSVLLLEPFVDEKTKWGSFQVEGGYIPPLGMIALYSYLKHKGIPVKFIDTQFGDYTKDDIRNLLLNNRGIDIIGIPVFTNSAYYSFRTAQFCKEVRPDVTIVLGGVHATSLPQRTLEECPSADYIVMGEGEITFFELITKINNKETLNNVCGIAYRSEGRIICNPPREHIKNLDELPRTYYDDIDLSRYVPHPTQYKALPNFPIVTQRGCPYQCTFCEASLIHGKKVRRYSVPRVLDELDILVHKFGAKGIYFQDSTFTIDRKYVTELLEKMIKRKFNLLWACNTRVDRVDRELLHLMKRAGCWMISYGIESANQQSLDILKKGITVEQTLKSVALTKKAGISILGSFILALPGEDEKMVQNTIAFAKKLLPDIALFYLPMPYPGSELYQIGKKTHEIREGAQWKDYIAVDFNNPVYVNNLLKSEKMRYYYKKAYHDYYSNPRYLTKMLFTIRSLNDVRRYWRGLRAVSNAF